MDTTSSPTRPAAARFDRIMMLIIIVLAVAVLIRLPRHQARSVTTDTGNSAASANALSDREPVAAGELPGVGDIAPDFTLHGLDGTPVSLSQWHGHPVLINFWAPWCGPCRYEMPAIQNAYQTHQEHGFVVLAIAVDDTAKNVKEFVAEYDLTFRVLMDDGQVSNTYPVFGLPTSFVIAPDGRIASIHVGPLSEDGIDELLAAVH